MARRAGWPPQALGWLTGGHPGRKGPRLMGQDGPKLAPVLLVKPQAWLAPVWGHLPPVGTPGTRCQLHGGGKGRRVLMGQPREKVGRRDGASRGGCGITQRGSARWGHGAGDVAGQLGRGEDGLHVPVCWGAAGRAVWENWDKRPAGSCQLRQPPLEGDKSPGQSPGPPPASHHAGLTWTTALEPITSRTCPLRLVPLGSIKLTISAYWANWEGQGQGEMGGGGAPLSLPPVAGGSIVPAATKHGVGGT